MQNYARLFDQWGRAITLYSDTFYYDTFLEIFSGFEKYELIHKWMFTKAIKHTD